MAHLFVLCISRLCVARSEEAPRHGHVLPTLDSNTIQSSRWRSSAIQRMLGLKTMRTNQNLPIRTSKGLLRPTARRRRLKSRESTTPSPQKLRGNSNCKRSSHRYLSPSPTYRYPTLQKETFWSSQDGTCSRNTISRWCTLQILRCGMRVGKSLPRERERDKTTSTILGDVVTRSFRVS
jgi:hypothetical protein